MTDITLCWGFKKKNKYCKPNTIYSLENFPVKNLESTWQTGDWLLINGSSSVVGSKLHSINTVCDKCFLYTNVTAQPPLGCNIDCLACNYLKEWIKEWKSIMNIIWTSWQWLAVLSSADVSTLFEGDLCESLVFLHRSQQVKYHHGAPLCVWAEAGWRKEKVLSYSQQES